MPHLLSFLNLIVFCLLQQSSATTLTLGKAAYNSNFAQRVNAIHQRMTKHYKDFSIPNITKAIIDTNVDIKDHQKKMNLSQEKLKENHLIGIKTMARYYRYYLKFKNINVSPINQSAIENLEEAITYQIFFSFQNTTGFSKNVLEKYSSHCPTSSQSFSLEKALPSYTFLKGYPSHFQIKVCYFPKTKSIPSSWTFMLQVGNQYKLKLQLNSQLLAFLCIPLIAIACNVPLITASVFALSLVYLKSTHKDFITLHLGHDPRSPRSYLMNVNPETGKIEYAFGEIMLNFLLNLVLFSFLGPVNFMSSISPYILLTLLVLTVIDKALILNDRSIYCKKNYHVVKNENAKSSAELNIALEKLGGIPLPTNVSKVIRNIHHTTFMLVH